MEITRKQPARKAPTPSLADSQHMQQQQQQQQQQMMMMPQQQLQPQRLAPVRKLNRDTPSGLLIITEDESVAASSIPSVADHLSRTVL